MSVCVCVCVCVCMCVCVCVCVRAGVHVHACVISIKMLTLLLLLVSGPSSSVRSSKAPLELPPKLASLNTLHFWISARDVTQESTTGSGLTSMDRNLSIVRAKDLQSPDIFHKY